MTGWQDCEQGLPDAEDHFSTGRERDRAELAEDMNRLLGIGVPRRRYQPDRELPDVSGIKTQLGIG